jgi:hypothetical protein
VAQQLLQRARIDLRSRQESHSHVGVLLLAARQALGQIGQGDPVEKALERERQSVVLHRSVDPVSHRNSVSAQIGIKTHSDDGDKKRSRILPYLTAWQDVASN